MIPLKTRPLPRNERLLLSRFVRVACLLAMYPESVSAGRYLSSRYLAMGHSIYYIAILAPNTKVNVDHYEVSYGPR
jgi:hypothetical protein